MTVETDTRDRVLWRPVTEIRRRFSGSFDCPPVGYAIAECISRHDVAGRADCLSSSHAPATVNNPTIAARVVLLLQLGFPSNITRLVVAIVVDAAKRMLRRWARPNTGKKSLKAFIPFVAHPYPPPAIVFPVTALGVVASILHRVPRRIFGRIAHVVLAGACGCLLSQPATAGQVPRLSEPVPPRQHFGPAIAAAIPARMVELVARAFSQHGQPTITQPGQINQFVRHGRDSK